MEPDRNGGGEPAAMAGSEAWAAQIRLARARALAREITIDWERLAVPPAEREATERLRDELPQPGPTG